MSIFKELTTTSVRYFRGFSQLEDHLLHVLLEISKNSNAKLKDSSRFLVAIGYPASLFSSCKQPLLFDVKMHHH